MAKQKWTEQHPNFPSGRWEGFYLYTTGPGANRHVMSFMLNFKSGKVSGSGGDDVGPFIWQGEYDVSTMSVRLIKSYSSHKVNYLGMADTNGIYGSWELELCRGGFHIWPKKQENSGKAATVETKKKKLCAV